MALGPTGGYWGATGVIDRAQWPTATQPQRLLAPAQMDMADPQVWRDAATLFPFWDGTNNTDPRFQPTLPDTYATATGRQFAQWHTAHQLALLKDPARSLAAPVPDDGAATGIDDLRHAAFADGTTAVLSADGTRVYVLNFLQTADFARMPLADQRIIAATPGFQTQVAAPFNLVPDTVTPRAVAPTGTPVLLDTPEAARDAAKAQVDELRDLVAASPRFTPDARDRFLGDPLSRRDLYHYLFLEQLDLYDARLDQQAIFDLDRIDTDIEAIADRFTRFERYAAITPPTDGLGGALPRNMNSSDDAADVATGRGVFASGLDVFLKVESQLWEQAVRSAFVATTGLGMQFSDILVNLFDADAGTFRTYSDGFDRLAQATDLAAIRASRLDGPGILSTLQIIENYRKEAEAEGRSEELNQVDRLLKDYAEIQRMLNATLKLFKPVADTDKDAPEEVIALLGQTVVSQLDTAEFPRGVNVAAMFDTAASTRGNGGHPEEQRAEGLGYSRPTETLASSGLLIALPRHVWDKFAANLGDATKLLGQENQIRMDEINGLSREKNRNYDLASNTLSKLAELTRALTDI